eukprot:TRINITY_DN2331_c0_g1_i6.p1 TRINITY_DN2331_c0_g1~~TRINITY_DN2331_c0_g1_i6.p1  ORF type:complete len:336 (-),score=78.08 TRINITY_DN2331_c0_g1_i6:142-1017(-)
MTESQGDELCNQAETRLNSFSFFSSRRDKVEEAVELYIKAANQYKIAKKWLKAGRAFTRAAELGLEVSHGVYTSASNYVNAGSCYQKEDKEEATKSYKTAVKLFLDDGKLGTAAKHMKTIAEMAEEDGKITDAMIAYQSAADYYEAEGNFSSACTNCLLKVAYMSIEAKELQKAVEILEKVAQGCVSNNLTKYKMKDYVMDAGICRLGIGDLVSCKKALQDYINWQPEFIRTREYILLDNLLKTCDSYDGDGFSAAVGEYDSMKQMSAWQTRILLVVKEKLDEGDSADDLT